MLEKPIQSRGEARRSAIIGAAKALFLEKGYERTTLADIVKASGGSRASIYEYFGDKEGLFRTIMLQCCDRLQHTLDAIDTDARDVDEALATFAERFVTILIEEETLAVSRTLYGEGWRFPALVATVMQAGPNIIDAKLADYFRRQTAAGRMQVAEPDRAAQVFMAMIHGRIVCENIMGLRDSLSQQRLHDHVVQSVRIFLHGTAAQTR